jgi:hypothetical protein
MLINKDPAKTWNMNIDIENTISKEKIAWRPEHSIQYSKGLIFGVLNSSCEGIYF